MDERKLEKPFKRRINEKRDESSDGLILIKQGKRKKFKKSGGERTLY